ncbi:MAG: DUF2330 domain-containing protein, partial [Bacteroidota bacterium]
KFFVVKANLKRMQALGQRQLRPIQVEFSTDRFGLPIRLGMANANGNQDMVVYAFTNSGRVETTNYQTIEIPTNVEIPSTLQPEFGAFYKDVYGKHWADHGGKAVSLEYAWDVSLNNPVKCDPCNGPPPIVQEMKQAGVFWLTNNPTDKVFMTRLHVRYNRENFPQDLSFQITPNTARFQGRYVMRFAAQGDFSCPKGRDYLRELRKRREKEVETLASLTGWNKMKYDAYISQYDTILATPLPDYYLKKTDRGTFPVVPVSFPQGPPFLLLLLIATTFFILYHQQQNNTMLRRTLPLSLLLLLPFLSQAFCGFYVAKADAKLFNKASAVIIVRDGTQTVITMSSDFQGDVKDFAMVVPVPDVLSREQIRIADQSIFDKLDQYSGPRLVEYHDQNPCYRRRYEREVLMSAPMESTDMLFDVEAEEDDSDFGVSIVESYTVGEYDILILSATESDGLESWLTREGYKIPANAAEVLEPYIKSDMKFFVVKVNMDQFKSSAFQTLRPIQMSFRSDRFGLPIRLGMANAEADQDLIVYAFTRKGRIETANYRTVEIPSNVDIPSNLRSNFGQFYKDLFDRAWAKSGKNAVMMEYAWDLSGQNYVKCDPCVGPPPIYNDLREAGVFWLQGNRNGYSGNVFMTRLHARYNRKTFPQDLAFQITPNQQHFQGRYVMHNPAGGDLSCDEGQKYLKELHSRRLKEVNNLVDLTGWDRNEHMAYVSEFDHLIKGGQQPYFGPLPEKQEHDKGGLLPFGGGGFGGGNGWWILLLGMALMTGMALQMRRWRMLTE